jgi:hypothetical protein
MAEESEEGGEVLASANRLAAIPPRGDFGYFSSGWQSCRTEETRVIISRKQYRICLEQLFVLLSSKISVVGDVNMTTMKRLFEIFSKSLAILSRDRINYMLILLATVPTMNCESTRDAITNFFQDANIKTSLSYVFGPNCGVGGSLKTMDSKGTSNIFEWAALTNLMGLSQAVLRNDVIIQHAIGELRALRWPLSDSSSKTDLSRAGWSIVSDPTFSDKWRFCNAMEAIQAVMTVSWIDGLHTSYA